MGSIFHEIYVSNISTILITIPILLLVWSVIGAAFNKYMRIIGAVLAVIVVGAILYATVLSRGESGKGADFIPFSSFERAKIQPEMYRSMLMNVFLFVPMGLFLPFVFVGDTGKRILFTILFGLLMSVTIEAIQYFGDLGIAETDDVICNTVGTAIGSCAYLLSLLWIKLFNKTKQRKGERLMNDVHSLLLQVISAALFGKKAPDIAADQLIPLVDESKEQAVYPLAFSVLDSQLKENLSPEQYADCSEEFFRYAIAGTQNFAEHSELHELMTANEMPYVAMKGVASARYYPEPNLRSMGDVDFLVTKDNISQVGKLLESIGFAVDYGEEDDGIHIAYTRPPMSIWELHHSVNSIPNNEVGELIRAETDKTIPTAETEEVDGSTCRLPDKLHHGLIMLLHTASHLTSEGVGLRHLCDWVVFASALSDAEFREIFEKKLKRFGLWRFAQALTMLGIRYLGAPKRVWALEAIESRKLDDVTLEGLMNDILSGGNFGTKDMNRYREIKYISDRGKHTVSSGGILRQGLRTMNQKVYADYRTIEKHKILLPVGYFAEGGKYIGLLLTGKRKSSGTKQMLKEAAVRKRIYSALNLFKKN